MKRPIFILFLCCLILGGCDTSYTYAPVIEVSTIDAIPKTGSHRVVKGETLYQIAWRYGLDYRYLAARNHINPPYAIHPGQVIYLNHGGGLSSQPLTPIAKQPVIVETDTALPIDTTGAKWVWPTKGKVIASFSSQNKGVNIAGHLGQPIHAAAAGKVVYCGDGLRGYGNLIILKHNSLYLSAYAHNKAVFVKEGQNVIKGQKIAEMGNTGSDKIMLHFEIRRAGKPIDPFSLYR